MNAITKTIAALIGLAITGLAAQSALAEAGEGGNGARHRFEHRHEAAQAHREQWRKMNPEERAAKREEMRQRWQNMTPEQRAAFKNRDPGVNARQFNQRERIEQGVRSGALTKEETRELAAERREIRQEERQYKSDGVMTKEERKDLHQDLNAASKDIYSEKHDAEHR